MQIERMENESKFDYHRRLIYGKLVDKTLADVDYSELSELVYGQPYSSDVARRMLYGSRRTLELMDEERAAGGGSSAYTDEIDAKMIELRKERQKFYDQRREYNKLISADGRAEHLYDTLMEAAQHLGDTVGSLDFHKCVTADYSDNEAVIVFSDCWLFGFP